MQPWEHYEKTRNACCWTGVILGWVGNVLIAFRQPFGYLLWLSGLSLNIIGGYNWAKSKNRNPAFCLWGLLAPIGFLGLALLNDKWGEPTATVKTTKP